MKVSILGSGGHGWQSLAGYLNNTSDDIAIWYLPVDWGGFTGDFGRMLEKEGRKINNLLHKGQNMPIYPWGDINKIVSYYIQKKLGTETRQLFDNRFTMDGANSSLLVSNLVDFCFSIGLREDKTLEAKNYLITCLKELDSSSKGSISNFWHNYLYSLHYNMFSFNYFYHLKEIIPYNISLKFVADDRLVLKSGTLIGEDVIDCYTEAIDPKSLVLETLSKEEPNFGYLEHKLETSDFIIIPNGSIANWLPLVNSPKIAKILKEKSEDGKLISLMNLFHTQNEHQYSVYVDYLKSLGINPLVLGPRLHDIILNKDILRGYENENKILNNLDVMEAENYLGCLDIITQKEDPLVEGLKYKPESIKKMISIIVR